MRMPAGGSVTIRDLTKTYPQTRGETLIVLSNLTLDIQAGQVVAVLGPSGCGKTTLLKILAGLARPDLGTVTIASADGNHERPRIAVVFQDLRLFPWRTALNNVALPLELRGAISEFGITSARNALHVLGLGAFEEAYPHQLSAGMQQRVSLARAIVADPELLLLDEPLGALDELTRDGVLAYLINALEHVATTALIVTHSPHEAALLGDRVIFLSARPGTVLQDMKIHESRLWRFERRNSPAVAQLVQTVRATAAQLFGG